jgi:hypothetical protein
MWTINVSPLAQRRYVDATTIYRDELLADQLGVAVLPKKDGTIFCTVMCGAKAGQIATRIPMAMAES